MYKKWSFPLVTGRYWEMIERLGINQFSITPSAIRRLMKADEDFVRKHDLSSLKTIGSGIKNYFGAT